MIEYYGNNDYRDYLMHYGIKGMKWGKRKSRQEYLADARETYESIKGHAKSAYDKVKPYAQKAYDKTRDEIIPEVKRKTRYEAHQFKKRFKDYDIDRSDRSATQDSARGLQRASNRISRARSTNELNQRRGRAYSNSVKKYDSYGKNMTRGEAEIAYAQRKKDERAASIAADQKRGEKRTYDLRKKKNKKIYGKTNRSFKNVSGQWYGN